MSADNHTSAEVFWQAFRYASDEMTAAEREAFDTLLAVDQSAREAVARVVELEGLVRTIENAPAEVGGPLLSVLPAERNYWLQPLGWVAVGAAACLATVMAFQAWWPAPTVAPSVAPQVAVGGSVVGGSVVGRSVVKANAANGSVVKGELALAWAQAQAKVPVPDDSLIGAPVAIIDENTEHDLAAASDDQVAAAPSWLLAAVADAEAMHDEN